MQYNMLTLLNEAGSNRYGQKLWTVRCECGVVTTKLASSIRTGRTKSCGCLASAGTGRLTHGKRRTRLYTTWCNVKARCLNPKAPAYRNYGGRGILLHSTWMEFKNFAQDVGDPPGTKHTLDRINNNGNYEPGNVRWTSRHVQSRNKRDNVMISIGGQVKCLYDWCDHYKISAGSVYRRMSNGEDIVSAIIRPKAKRFQKDLP